MHYPLGQNIPDSMHAVCVSLPTMDAVIGYEEGRADVTQAVHHAYPRFVVHPYIHQVIDHLSKRFGLEERCIVLLAEQASVASFSEFLNLQDYSVSQEADFTIVHFPNNTEHQSAAKYFLQHTGLGISSRQAEAYLLNQGRLTEPQTEKSFKGDAKGYLKSAIQQYVESDDIGFTRSGMAAFYAGFQASQKIQHKRGKHI